MLREVQKTRQITGEPYRRWFSDETFDLIVWYDASEKIIGFQLCYRAWPDEKALTWLRGEGFSHNRIDQGEGRPDHHKMTPILLPDGEFEAGRVLQQFLAAGTDLDPEVVGIVTRALKHYPNPDFE
ncbi:MAG: hypothetical protein P8010_10885 [Desulfosarcinaceae bacterium]|jgi:hypothetical protein